MFELNPLNWEIEVYGTLPDDTLFPLKCVGVEIDGVKGILIRSGQWFNLETRQWVQKTSAPYIAGLPNQAR